MKKIFLIAISTWFLTSNGQGQSEQFINFDDTVYKKWIYVDSSNTSNIWQIGKPQKTIFNSAFSQPNVIITDSLGYYPPNDTSSFTIRHIAFTQLPNSELHFQFLYKIDADSCKDYGKFELSVDKGQTWHDIINDSIINLYTDWGTLKPVFTGLSTNWSIAHFIQYGLLQYLGVQPYDTVLFRFTFFSDSTNNTHEGWMIDNIFIEEIQWGIDDKELKSHCYKVFLNYEQEKLYILSIDGCEHRSDYLTLKVHELSGKQKIYTELTREKQQIINVSKLEKGIYIYSLYDGFQIIQTGKFILLK